MTEEEITKETQIELKKNIKQMANDIIREANSNPNFPTFEQKSLDIIKHLLKRLDLQQLNTIKRQNKTNRLLILLSVIMTIGSICSVVTTILFR